MNIFHVFEMRSKTTGNVVSMTQIGATAEAAENTLRRYNFAGLDWANWELRHITPEEVKSILDADNYQEILGSL